MRIAFFTGAACLSLVGIADAATLDVNYADLPSGGSYFAPSAISSTSPYEEGVTGSSPGLRTSPFSDDSTPYDAVEANGSATFGVAAPVISDGSGPILEAAFSRGPSDPSFGTGNNSFSFVWGTPDSYNGLAFYEGNSFLGSVTGSSAPIPLGSGSYLATVTGMGEFDRVVFTSDGANAFEFAAVSPVPLPASAPMFGAALVVLGVAGYGLKRKSKAAAT